MVLETPRLHLRHLTPDDLPHLIALHSDPEVMRWITNGQPSDPAEMRDKVLPRWLSYYQQYNAWGFFAAIDKATGDFAGWFHLHPRDPRNEADVYELGYRLHARFWGRGLATEGSKRLLGKLLMEGRPAKVAARTMAGNAVSRRVMEKLGLCFARDYQEQKFPAPDQHAVWYERDTETIIQRRVWACQLGVNPTMIRRLPSGWLVLFDFQTLPGYTALLSDPVIRDINAASPEYRQLFLRDMVLVGDALLKATGARLINYMLLGNTDFALHAHIVARYENEPPEDRKTGVWVYYPTHRKEQVMFDATRDADLMHRIGEELDRVCAAAR